MSNVLTRQRVLSPLGVGLSRISTAEKTRCQSTMALTNLSEEEQAMKDMVKRLAQEKIQPLVKKMDDESMMDRSVIDLLFQNGVIYQ